MNARNSSATLKQPSGTNHFQFRFDQFGLVLLSASAVGPRASSTSVMKLFAMHLFQRSKLDGSNRGQTKCQA